MHIKIGGRSLSGRQLAFLAAAVPLLCPALLAVPAHAATAQAHSARTHSPHWTIRGLAKPTQNFTTGGGTNYIYNANSWKVAEVYHSGTGDYANVDQYHYNGTLTQQWYFYLQFYAGGDPVVTIVNANSGKCLEVYQSQLNDYANVDQYSCNGTFTQEWLIVPTADGNFRLVNWNSFEDMEVYHSWTSDFANIDQYHYNGTLAQEWSP